MSITRRLLGGAAALAAGAALWALGKYLNAPEPEDADPEGWWSEGFHYDLEFREGRLTLLDYARRTVLYSPCVCRLTGEGKWELCPGERTLGFEDSAPFGTVNYLRFNGRELELCLTLSGGTEQHFLLSKAAEGPFADILPRDGELFALEGEWRQAEGDCTLRIADGYLTVLLHGAEQSRTPVRAVGYRGDSQERLYLVNADLTEKYIGDFPGFELRDGTLVSYRESWGDDAWPVCRFLRQ